MAALDVALERERGPSWSRCRDAQSRIEPWLENGLRLTKVRLLLARDGVEIPYPTLHPPLQSDLRAVGRPEGKLRTLRAVKRSWLLLSKLVPPQSPGEPVGDRPAVRGEDGVRKRLLAVLHLDRQEEASHGSFRSVRRETATDAEPDGRTGEKEDGADERATRAGGHVHATRSRFSSHAGPRVSPRSRCGRRRYRTPIRRGRRGSNRRVVQLRHHIQIDQPSRGSEHDIEVARWARRRAGRSADEGTTAGASRASLGTNRSTPAATYSLARVLYELFTGKRLRASRRLSAVCSCQNP